MNDWLINHLLPSFLSSLAASGIMLLVHYRKLRRHIYKVHGMDEKKKK